MPGYRFVRPRPSGRRMNSDSYFAGPWGAMVFVGVLVLAAVGVIKVIQNVQEKTEADKNQAASKGGLPGVRRTAPNSGITPPSDNRAYASSGQQAQPPARPSVQSALNELNVAVVSSEVARLRGESAARGRYLEEAANALTRANGFGASLPDHLEPGDQITAFETFDLMKMDGPDAAATLTRALDKKGFQVSYRFRVRRNGERELSVLFPPQTGSSNAAFSSSGRTKITNQLAQDVQKQVLSLPDGVLSSNERAEIERILGKGEATPEEMDTLTRRMSSNDAAKLAQDQDFKTPMANLERLLPTGPVPDVLLTKEGKKVAGKVFGDTAAAVTMETSYGKVTTHRAEVRHVYLGDELREEFKRRLEGCKDNAPALRELLVWTKEWQLPVQREYVAYKLLQLYPQDPQARMEAGYSPGAGGRWVLGNSIASGAKPTLRKASTRAEMATELLGAGYVRGGDRWFTRESWSAVIDTLHSPSTVRMTMSGCELYNWYEGDTPEARLFNPTGKPKDGSLPRLRFLAPSAQTGTVTLTVEAPGDFHECHLKVSGSCIERTNQGKVECFVTPEGSATQTLYSITQASDVSLHDVTAMMRGKRKFTVTVRMTTIQDKYHTYSRLFQSLPDSKEVFQVKGVLLTPSPEIDKTWASTPE